MTPEEEKKPEESPIGEEKEVKPRPQDPGMPEEKKPDE